MTGKIRKLQGIVVDIEKTGESTTDEEGNKWEKCIFIVELTDFSKRTPKELLPDNIRVKKVKLVRFCCFDWHYKLGIKKTLDSNETEDVLMGKQTETVFW